MIKILILAGRLNRDHADRSISFWLDRLEKHGLDLQVLCRSRGFNPDPRLVEAPALANRWLRGAVVRRLQSDGLLRQPNMMHVIDSEMVDLAIALSQDQHLPYVQTVSHFAALDRGLKLSTRWCRHLIAPSKDLAHALMQLLHIPADRIVVIAPGIVALSRNNRIVDDWKVPVVGAGGPFEETSGLLTFLEAARIVVELGHDAEFILTTQSGRQSELRRRAKRLEIAERVTVGEYPIAGAQLWNALDIYCQPSAVASAGHTLAVALAHGVPCIATNVSGLRSWIESGENGLLVAPDDAEGLAKAISFLIHNPQYARHLGENGIAGIERQFDPEVEANRLAALYKQTWK